MRLPLILLVLLFVACAAPEPPREQRTAAGKCYGGVFNANEKEELLSLFPLRLTQAAAHRIAAQIYDGLVRLDQRDLSITPALATAWSIDPTGTEYTFNLRPKVFFHDDACFPDGRGRELNANDVAHCFNRICTNEPGNLMFWLFQDRIAGANKHYAEGTGEVEGIQAIDDHTLRIKLTAPWPGFLYVLAHQGCWIYPKELTEHYKADAPWHPVGTGAFKVKTFERGEVLVLERVPNYWRKDGDGSALPYLDAVRYTFAQEKDSELNAFEHGNLTMSYELPTNKIDELKGDPHYTVQETPSYSTQFYGFNASRAPFTDVRVRKALNMAVDRHFLVDSMLQGLGYAAEHGVVAPGFADYPYDLVPTLSFDPEGARRLLAEAGFPGGRGLPSIVLNVNNDRFGYIEVAEAVQDMLEKELGVHVILSMLPSQQHYETIARNQATMWREGWVADHPDPENFLALFYGRNTPADTAEPSYLNSTRHRNEVYDRFYTDALHTSDVKKRMHLLAQAEANLMENATVMPLYHERSVRLLQPWVRDLPINPMEYIDLALVWFDPATKKP